MPDPLSSSRVLDESRERTWRFALCDLLGTPITIITSLVDEAKFTDSLSRPKSMTISLDSSDRRIRALHTDGYPKLHLFNRVLKAWRREWVDVGGGNFDWRYVIRFAGHVWPLDDQGDADSISSTFTAFDPMRVLANRFARHSDGTISKVPFSAQTLGTILSSLVSRTNTYRGASGLTTSGGSFTASQTGTVSWEYKMISECIGEMAQMADVYVTPQDVTNGNHGIINCVNRRGSLKPNLLMGFADDPRTLDEMQRTYDADNAANVVVGIGGEGLTAAAEDAANQLNFIPLEKLVTFSDATDQTTLNAQVTAELARSLPPQESLTIKPFGDLRPWDDFDVGDSGTVLAGVDFRGGFAPREERIYGMTVTVDADDNEDVELVTEKETA